MTAQRVIFDDENVCVLFTPGRSETWLVTFTSWAKRPPAKPFALSFAHKHDLSAILFIAKHNDWWQNRSIDEAIGRANDLGDCGRRVAYGSSMGGFGAIALGARLRCTTVIAMSPQATIDRAIVPWEKRWSNEASSLTSALANAGYGTQADQAIHIAYDHRDGRDRRHADLISDIAKRNGTDVHLHSFPFSGHVTIRSLLEANALSSFVLDILNGVPDPCAALRRYRDGRWSSPSCARAFLGAAQPRRLHPKLAARAAQRFKLEVPWSAQLACMLARSFCEAGRYEEAIEELALAEAAADAKIVTEARVLRAQASNHLADRLSE